MPYQVIKNKNDKYQLKKLKDNKTIKTQFQSKEKAINQAKNWMLYRKEKPIVKGNKILNKNKL